MTDTPKTFRIADKNLVAILFPLLLVGPLHSQCKYWHSYNCHKCWYMKRQEVNTFLSQFKGLLVVSCRFSLSSKYVYDIYRIYAQL